MALDLFTPPKEPSYNGTSQKTKANLHVANFGDGYTQRAVAGINNIRRTFPLKWATLTKADMQTITDFLEVKAGAIAFRFVPPTESVEVVVTCNEWTETPDQFESFGISATFTEEFDLA